MACYGPPQASFCPPTYGAPAFCAPVPAYSHCDAAPYFPQQSFCAPAVPQTYYAPAGPQTMTTTAHTDQVVERREGRNLVEMWGTPIYKKVPVVPGIKGRLFGPRERRIVGHRNIQYKTGEYVEDAHLVNAHTQQVATQCVGPTVNVVPL